MVGTGNLGNYCIFHRHHEYMVIAGTQPQVNFMNELQKEIVSKNGNWRGFSFPAEFRLSGNVDFQISAQFSIFNDLKLEGVTFEDECRFTDSKFRGDAQLKTCHFKKNADFTKCVFENKTEFLNVFFHGVASFGESEFIDRVSLRVNFSESANFSSTIFKDAVTFSGWRNISLSLSSASLSMSAGFATVTQSNQTIAQKIRQSLQVFCSKAKVLKESFLKLIKSASNYIKVKFEQLKRRFFTKREGIQDYLVFEKEGQLNNVTFYKPDQTVFNNVNMSKVYLAGTNFRGSRFLGVYWHQPKLKRNGLYDELFIRNSGDANFIQKQLPQLEESYRNIRVTLEDNLNYEAAADFYVGEMDTRRAQLNIFRRHFFSVTALYKAVSNYGTSVFTAFRVLLWIILFHWAITLFLNFDFEKHDIQFTKDMLLRSFSQFSFHNLDESTSWIVNPFLQRWVDIGLKLFGISQLAMLVFAFRTRIKRH